MAFPDPGAEGAELATAGSGAPVSSLAPEFSELSDYLGGEYVTHGGRFWQCPSGREAGPWDPEDFVETTVGDDLTLALDDAAAAASSAAQALGNAYKRLYATDAVPQYVVSATYQPGDMATYSNQPWVCVSAGTTGAWSQGRWARTTLYDQVALKSELSGKADASAVSRRLYALDAVPQYVTSGGKVYQPGDMATLDDRPWVCLCSDVSGSWDPSKWAQTTLYGQFALKGELSAKQGAILDRIQALEESLGQIGSKLDQILE